MDRKELGAYGETLATEFLVSRGFIVLTRNLQLKLGEVDILMRDGETIVVVEVKTQTGATLIDPIYKISPAKQRKLQLLARVIATRYPDTNIRVDAVTVYWKPDSPDPVCTYYPNII